MLRFKRLHREVVVLLSLSIAAVLGCGEGAGSDASVHGVVTGIGDGHASTIQITPATASIEEGAATPLNCLALDSRGVVVSTSRSWSISDPNVATVGANGTITANHAGNAVVSCTVDGKTALATIIVAPSPVAFLEVSPGSGVLVVGKSLQLVGTPLDSNGAVVPGHDVKWTTPDSMIATVSSSGAVVGRSEGTANVMATSGGKATFAKISVAKTTPAPVAAISIKLDDATLNVGQLAHGTATTVDSTGQTLTGRSIVWTVSDPSVLSAVATAGNKANVTGRASGTAVLTATSEGKSTSVTVSVALAPVQTVVVNLASASILPGQTTQATATLTDALGNVLTGRTVTWSTLDPSIATVSSVGVVTGVASGAVVIRATSEGQTGDGSLTVSVAAVATVSVTFGSSTLSTGQTTQAIAVARDASGNVLTGRSVAWSSLNPGIATVSIAGVVSAVASGSATIQAVVETKNGDGPLTVGTVTQVQTATTSSVVVTLDSSSLAPGNTSQAHAVAKDAQGSLLSGKTATWVSTNTAVATVSTSGVVTAVSAGSVGIQGTIDGVNGSAPLAVNVPLVVTAPAPSGEPTYSSATGALVFKDSIDEYTTPHAMWTSTSTAIRFVQAPFGEDVDSLTLITGRGGVGKALHMQYSGVYQDSHNWDVVNGPTLPDTTTHFFSYYARVTVAGPMPLNGMPVKWFMAWHPTGNRVEWDTHDYLPCNVYPAAHTIWQVYDNGATSCQGNQPVGPYPDNVFDGQWHRYTYQYRPNTRTGSRDGVARMWVDGIKVIDVSLAAAAVVPPGGYKPWCSLDDIDALNSVGVNYLRFGSVLTKDTPSFTIDIDDFIWWHSK